MGMDVESDWECAYKLNILAPFQLLSNIVLFLYIVSSRLKDGVERPRGRTSWRRCGALAVTKWVPMIKLQINRKYFEDIVQEWNWKEQAFGHGVYRFVVVLGQGERGVLISPNLCPKSTLFEQGDSPIIRDQHSYSSRPVCFQAKRGDINVPRQRYERRGDQSALKRRRSAWRSNTNNNLRLLRERLQPPFLTNAQIQDQEHMGAPNIESHPIALSTVGGCLRLCRCSVDAGRRLGPEDLGVEVGCSLIRPPHS